MVINLVDAESTEKLSNALNRKGCGNTTSIDVDKYVFVVRTHKELDNNAELERIIRRYKKHIVSIAYKENDDAKSN